MMTEETRARCSPQWLPRLVVAVLLLASCDSAQPVEPPSGTVTGRVSDSATDARLSGAQVSIGSVQATSGEAGVYSVSGIPVGNQTITASLSGYEAYSVPITVVAGTRTHDIQLDSVVFNGKNTIGMKFQLIPAGTFTMGWDYGPPDERPAHQVTLTRAFWLGKYEVTQAEYFAVTGQRPSFWSGGHLPVERIEWFDAVDFANALSRLESLLECYDASRNPVGDLYACTGYRLPTEAEWEYAARAGTTTEYSWGSYGDRDATLYAWYEYNSSGRTHEVGTKAAERWGLYDVHGNVWEWVHDNYGRYRSNAETDPLGVVGDISAVFRGGSWFLEVFYLRSADRYKVSRVVQDYQVGFRLARGVG